MRLTNSCLSVFRECPRKYYYAYIRLMVPIIVSPALSIGRVIHQALEAWWLHGLNEVAVALNKITADITEADCAKIAAMLSYYAPPKQQYVVDAIEQVFNVPIINPATGRHMRGYTLGGKVDGLIRRRTDDKLYLLEHKTTSEDIIGFGPFWQRLSIDHQISYYMAATGAEGCMYDVLKKPTLTYKQVESEAAFEARRAELIATSMAISKERLPGLLAKNKIKFEERIAKLLSKYINPMRKNKAACEKRAIELLEKNKAMFEERRAKLIADSETGTSSARRQTGETPDEYQTRCEAQIIAAQEEFYQFREVHKTPEDIAEAQADLWDQAHMLKSCHQSDMWPRNSGACRGFYGMCKYLDVCTGMARLDDETLFRCKEQSNEELS